MSTKLLRESLGGLVHFLIEVVLFFELAIPERSVLAINFLPVSITILLLPSLFKFTISSLTSPRSRPDAPLAILPGFCGAVGLTWEVRERGVVGGGVVLM